MIFHGFPLNFSRFDPFLYQILAFSTHPKARGAHGHQAEVARAHALEVVVREAAHTNVLQAIEDAHDVAPHVILLVELVEARVPTSCPFQAMKKP